jgi:hypothetical protein
VAFVFGDPGGGGVKRLARSPPPLDGTRQHARWEELKTSAYAAPPAVTRLHARGEELKTSSYAAPPAVNQFIVASPAPLILRGLCWLSSASLFVLLRLATANPHAASWPTVTRPLRGRGATLVAVAFGFG